MVDDFNVQVLKRLEKAVGKELAHELSPIITDLEGEIADGNTRLAADKSWTKKPFKLTKMQVAKIGLILNWGRRSPEPRDFNRLAEQLIKEEPGDRPYKVKSGVSIVTRIEEITGIPIDAVEEYLDERYKQPQKVGDTPTIGIGKQVRVLPQLTPAVESLMSEVKKSIKENPATAEKTIDAVKTIMLQTQKGVNMTAKADKAMKKSATLETEANPTRPTTSEERTAFSILNTLTPEDRKVFEELRNKGGAGKYLEKKVGEVGAKTVMDHIKVITGIMPLRVTGLIKPLLRLTLSTPLRCPSCKFEFTLDPAKPVDWWEKLQFTIAKQDEQRFMDLLKKLAESKSIEEMAPFAEVPG